MICIGKKEGKKEEAFKRTKKSAIIMLFCSIAFFAIDAMFVVDKWQLLLVIYTALIAIVVVMGVVFLAYWIVGYYAKKIN
jgi:hypothetical protein